MRSCSSVSCATAMPRHGTPQPGRRARSSASAADDRALAQDRAAPAPVRSTTVDGVPGQLAAVDDDGARSRISAGTSSSRRGSGPPWRFALVAATAPTRATIRRAAPPELGHAHADRVRDAARSATRGVARDSASTSVNGPAERTRDADSSGIEARRRASTLAATSAIGWSARAALERRERTHGLLPIRAAREPVDGVGRDDDELARLDRRNRPVDRLIHTGG